MTAAATTAPVRLEATHPERPLPAPAPGPEIETIGLRAWFGAVEALKGVTMPVPLRRVTAIIGPSGCGKSTLIRCLNRLHEEAPHARVAGEVRLRGANIYAPGVDPVAIRRRVGMVFQRPNPFPALSVRGNVLAGYRLNGLRPPRADDLVEAALRRAALWDEIKDDLHRPGASLSGGQQQRLCIARALALEPEVLLMDEPCSALDPVATARIESLIHELAQRLTVVIVTHNMQQAARVSDFTAFLYLGELCEYAETDTLFTRPGDRRTEDYITGRFG
jgi:phosphate transport system ATP-binding protein